MPNLTKPEPLVKTSAGLETASQTVERVKANRYGTPPSTPPAGSVASISPYAVPDYLTEAEKAQSNLLRINEGDANQKVNSNQEYRNALKQYQQQIDATNAVYADQLNQSRIAGQGRLGTSRAGQARGGLLGSDFGSAQTNDVTSANQQADQSIQNAQQVALQTIYGLARADANANMAAKVAAKKAGAEALVKYYTETVPTQRTAKISKVAQALFDKNIDPTTLSSQEKSQLAEGWGVSYDDIQSNYNALKTANEEAQAKQAREIAKEQSAMDKTTADIAKINADIESGKLITIGEGTMLYNTETGETMKNPKTYAPSDGGGTVTPLGGETPLVGQANYSKLTAGQKKQADSLNNLVRSLKEYETYYNDNAGALGGAAGNLFGADSGLLQTKLNSIIFAAAQAEGTGALQQADRQVIEQIIPNPTSVGGAFNTLIRGGKEGNIAKIQDQINKYTANLGGYGLVPTDGALADSTTTAVEDLSYLTDEELAALAGQ